jgi:hypothetical protein
VIEHPRWLLEQRLRHRKRTSRIAWEQHSLCQLGVRLKVIGADFVL